MSWSVSGRAARPRPQRRRRQRGRRPPRRPRRRRSTGHRRSTGPARHLAAHQQLRHRRRRRRAIARIGGERRHDHPLEPRVDIRDQRARADRRPAIARFRRTAAGRRAARRGSRRAHTGRFAPTPARPAPAVRAPGTLVLAADASGPTAGATMPKSVIRTEPSSSISTLAGLRSRCRDAVRVRGRQAVAQLPADVEHFLGGQPAGAPQQRRQVLAVDQLHRIEDPVFGFADVEDAAHRRMRDLPREPHLVENPARLRRSSDRSASARPASAGPDRRRARPRRRRPAERGDHPVTARKHGARDQRCPVVGHMGGRHGRGWRCIACRVPRWRRRERRQKCRFGAFVQ